MFKRSRFAAIMAIVVAIVVANTADARPGSSVRSGFSSKSTATRSAAAPRQPGFGSFGQRQSQPPAAGRMPQRDSAMSRDLDRKAAQEQAMRTYDARRSADTMSASRSGAAGTGAAGTMPPQPPAVPGGGNGSYGGPGGYAQHGTPATVVVRERNNGWLWGLGGFMLGHAASGHAAPPPAAQPAPAPSVQQADVSGNSGAMADAAGANDIVTAGEANPAPVRAPVAKPAAQESSTLAKLVVALLLGAMVWLAWKAFRTMARAQEVKKNTNYSFERN
ncbi:hypothetical protein [Pseudoduganella violaceinigra]|uniref:hypothetical protein n=1 Tax=Pseudoduganella violaceinigra TaxID=246602 RepID=UPI00041092A8|nr:hypothetical protein [Pseudoduganella violaceinigra]